MKRRAARLTLFLLAAILVLAFEHAAVSAQQPALDDLLAKAAKYAAAFADPSRALVCEESYEHTYFRRMMNIDGRSERAWNWGRKNHSHTANPRDNSASS